MAYSDLAYLQIPLPEAVAKEKWSGNFDSARQRIRALLQKDNVTQALKRRLELELVNLDYMERRYTVSVEEAVRIMQKRIPDFTAEELETLRTADKADWIYLNGEVRYLNNFANTLYAVYPQIWKRTREGDARDYNAVQRLVEDLRDGQDMTAHIRIRQRLTIRDSAVLPGKTLSVHLPVPREGGGVENLNIIAVEPKPVYFSGEEALQSTAYFNCEAKADIVFTLEYAFDHRLRYRDMGRLSPEKNMKELLEKHVKAQADHLLQQPPHICFTPYLRVLEKEIAAGETNPLILARRFYDYITTKTDYRFVRDYGSIDNLPEYCALNRRGDCGIQALLFITLCRIAGIPAKWQSGLDAKPGSVSQHDWAMFFLPQTGWVHADLSYGGAAYVRGALDRWNFYFGNIDPYRVPVNNGFQKEFDPPKKHRRIDPYDNQCGEAEYEDRGLLAEELCCEYTDMGIR